MRVLIAPDAFAGTLTAVQAAAAMREGWLDRVPTDVVTTCPLSAGGPGFVDVLLAAHGGDLVPVTVSGPHGGQVPATLLLDGDGTAYVEAAQACGRHHRSAHHRLERRRGELLRAAVTAGARRVVVATGGLGSHDGGAGALAVLGAGDPTALGRGGLALAELPDVALAGLAAARESLRGVEPGARQRHRPAAARLPRGQRHRGRGPWRHPRAGAGSRGGARPLRRGRRALARGRPQPHRPEGSPAAPGPVPGAASGTRCCCSAPVAPRPSTSCSTPSGSPTGSPPPTSSSPVRPCSASTPCATPSSPPSRRRPPRAACPPSSSPRSLEVGRREAQAIGVSGAYAVRDARTGDLEPAPALAARTARVARTWSR
nr:glycerate kinase [Angustibacter aerolatus]